MIRRVKMKQEEKKETCKRGLIHAVWGMYLSIAEGFSFFLVSARSYTGLRFRGRKLWHRYSRLQISGNIGPNGIGEGSSGRVNSTAARRGLPNRAARTARNVPRRERTRGKINMEEMAAWTERGVVHPASSRLSPLISSLLSRRSPWGFSQGSFFAIT